MKISVIIPCYNSVLTIIPCIKAVLANSLPPFEVIVVDDASDDDTVNTVESVFLNGEIPIKLVCLDTNGGPARGRNQGAAIAEGDFLFFVDSDTELMPQALENFSKRINECDAVCGIYHDRPLNKGIVPLYKATLNYQLFSRQGVIPYQTFSASCAGIRTPVFHELGGFNDELAWGMDYENEEFGRRIIKDHMLLLDPDVAARHAFPGSKELSRTYYHRVSLWVELFLGQRQFKSTGTATATGGVGTAAVPPMLACLMLTAIWPATILAAVPFFILWLWNYAGYFWFVLKKYPGFLPIMIVLNLYFSCVITGGALDGVVHWVSGQRRIATTEKTS